jgi:hypothetical protein
VIVLGNAVVQMVARLDNPGMVQKVSDAGMFHSNEASPWFYPIQASRGTIPILPQTYFGK